MTTGTAPEPSSMMFEPWTYYWPHVLGIRKGTVHIDGHDCGKEIYDHVPSCEPRLPDLSMTSRHLAVNDITPSCGEKPGGV